MRSPVTSSCALVAILCAMTTVACTAKPVPSAEAAPTSGRRESLRLEPGNEHLKFIKIESVAETDALPSLRLTGKISFDEDHTQRLAAPIDGRATRILVEAGAQVKKGQALIELTSPQVSTLQADAQKSQQDLALMAKAMERARTLRQDGAISEKDAAQVEADYRKSKADVARTGAQLTSLNVSPTDPTVSAALRTQISGTVVERNVLVGQEVRADATTPLFTISDLGTVWVYADVYEQDLALVQPGAPAKIHVAAYPDEVFDARIVYVGDIVDPASHTVKIRCAAPNPTHRLKPEMFASIELGDSARRRGIVLPASAVLTDSAHTSVIVEDANHEFRMRTVTVGPEVEHRVRVLAGLTPGELVVTDGAIFLKRELESD
jgi:membrane fusion protein, heavy metal efflux system